MLETWQVAGGESGEVNSRKATGPGGGAGMSAQAFLQARAGVACIGLERDGTIAQWDDSARALFGYDDALMAGGDLSTLVPSPEEGATLRGFFRACLRGGGASEVTTSCVNRNGESLFCRWYAVPATGQDGQAGLAVLVKDVTEQMRAVTTLNRVRGQARSLFSNAPIGMFQADSKRHVVAVNPELSWMLGYESPAQLTDAIDGVSGLFFASGEAQDYLFQLYEGEQLNRFQCRLRRRDGGAVWAMCYGQVTRNAKGRVNGFYGFAIDISRTVRVEEELKCANEKLRLASIQDALTRIANRGHFDACLAREWKRHAREKAELSLIICDIDHFKRYNDTYGHPAGDHCLKEVAKALASCVKRPGDLVARYGGEEFVVILPHTDLAGARHLAEGMRHRVASLAVAPEGAGGVTHVTLSLGVASVFPCRRASEKELIDMADRALYRAKELGRDRCVASEEGQG